MTDDTEVLKLGKLNLQKNIKIEKKSNERYWMDMSYDKNYNERDWIGENDKEITTDGIEVLEQGKLSPQKTIEKRRKNMMKEIGWI